MKLLLALLAVLAVAGLSQAHKVPNFGKGPLHEDIQDFLDLIPMQEIAEIFLDYLANDEQIKEIAKYLNSSYLLKDLVEKVEAVPEVINLFNYLQRNGVDIYNIVNAINKVFGIRRLVPPTAYSVAAKRTGGLAGLFKDVMKQYRYRDFIRLYVHKMKTSPAFADFIKQLKSDNFQQIVNKIYNIDAFKFMLSYFKDNKVDLRIVADILYIVLGITVPNDAISTLSLIDEIMDFMKLIPTDKIVSIVTDYMTNDKKVQKAARYPLTPEFHSLLRAVEALDEHKQLVIYMNKVGLDIVDAIKSFHKLIGMEDYVPPKIEAIPESEIGVAKIGDGFKAMLDDVLVVIPVDKIRALYEEKMKNSKVFADFIAKVTSPEYQRIVKALKSHEVFQEMVGKCKESELDLVAMEEFYKKILPISAQGHFYYVAY